jgi:hypothetical protein
MAEPSPREAFLATVPPTFAPIVAPLAALVEESAPELTPRLSYGMLTYVYGRDYRSWVVAIGVTSKVVSLRLLFGVLLDDPRGLLRHGTSSLANLDFASLDQVDDATVRAFVSEAAKNHERFKTEWAASGRK